MKRWVPVLVLAASLGGCGAAPVRIDALPLASSGLQAPDRFIIAAVENNPLVFLGRAGSTPRGYDAIAAYGPSPVAVELLRSVERDYGLEEVSSWPIEPLHMHCAVLEIPAGGDAASVVSALSHDARVKLAEPLQTFATRAESYNDPYVSLQRGFEQMDVADAHPVSRGEGVRVAIIDTGADTQHPDLRGTIVAAQNFVDTDDGQFRRDRHGTEIAGIIAAVANNGEGIVGIAPAARLMVFKACWQSTAESDAARCNSFTLARALVAAFDAHAQVVNLSIAGPEDPLLYSLIQEGMRRGILFVGAAPAGSGLRTGGLLHQAGVIEVAMADSPSPNSDVILAPGREILTLTPGGHYDFASGASLATAHVTGVVALLLARNRELSAASAYQLLRGASVHLASAGAGSVLVDACAAVTALVGRGSCRQTALPDTRAGDERPGRFALH